MAVGSTEESAYAVDQAQHTLAVYTRRKFESGSTLPSAKSDFRRGQSFCLAMSQDRHALAVGFQEAAIPSRPGLGPRARTRIGALGNF